MDLKYLAQEMKLNPLCQVLQPKASGNQIPPLSSVVSKPTRLIGQPDLVLLSTAIDNLSSERLRYIFKSMCEQIPQAARLASDALLVMADKVLPESSECPTESDGNDSSNTENGMEDGDSSENEEELDSSFSEPPLKKKLVAVPGTKRKAPSPDPDSLRYQKCENCDEEFDVTKNLKGCCLWHEGSKEVNDESSVWDDWEDFCFGYREDAGDDYPEGFLWSCCDQRGVAEGCKKTTHFSGNSPKRIRC